MSSFPDALRAAHEDMETKHTTLQTHMAEGIPSLAGIEYAHAMIRFTDLLRNAVPELIAVLEWAKEAVEENELTGWSGKELPAALDALDRKVAP